jgi:ElaB/YqjD/DUF883 family membrane-anchored ribosome-binding protein
MSSRIEEIGDEPRTVDEARNAVERSRQRISSTLDQLEDRIVEKKHELQEKVDFMRPVRDQIAQRPFTAVAVAVGVGALLGSIGGGDGEEEPHRSRSGRLRGSISDSDRKELRDWRKQRRERLRAVSRHGNDEEDGGSSRLSGLRHQLMGAVTAAVTTAVTSRLREFVGDSVGGIGRSSGDSRHR